MKYDFETVMDRHGKDAMAVDTPGHQPGFAPDAPDEGFDIIPMWVADMNFPVVPTIQQKLAERISHPAFGYFPVRDEYTQLIIRWHETRNHVQGLTPECIGYENGVLGGVISALNVLCSRGDNVLVHSPTYIGFTNCLTNNGYHIIHSPLRKDAQGIWRMDFEDMEEKIVQNHIHAAVFCSPHNPCGRVWERAELEQFAELCRRHDVYIVCDEIWSDLIMPGYTHIPMQSISEVCRMRTVALYAPSKTFNLAGLIGSYHIIYNPWLRDRVEMESSLCGYNNMNVLSMHALIGAYQPEGYEWVDELIQVLDRNIRYVCDHIDRCWDGIEVSRPQGTYMLYLDCSGWCRRTGRSIHDLEKAGWRVGVAWQDGEMFLQPETIRMNLALPFSRVQEAIDRLDRYVFS